MKGITKMLKTIREGKFCAMGNLLFGFFQSSLDFTSLLKLFSFLLVIDTQTTLEIIKMLIKSNPTLRGRKHIFHNKITMKVSAGDTPRHSSELLEFYLTLDRDFSSDCYGRI